MDSTEIARLPQDAAGRILTDRIPTIHPEATIGEIEALLIKNTKDLETIHYIYVVNEHRALLGVVSIKEVFRSPKTTKVKEVMHTGLVTARLHTGREHVALLAIEHKLKEVPIVDHENRLLGVVPGDAILSSLQEEHIEDTLRFAGIHRFTDPAKTVFTARAGTLIKKRLPWLMVGLLGGVFASFIIGAFEESLQAKLILASFIPAIVYIADAVGTQTQTIFIRSLSVDRGLRLLPYLLRELQIGLALGAILAALMAGTSLIIWQSIPLAVVLGSSFFAAIMAAIGAAVFFPWLFTRFHIDPAIASGPFATIIRDLLSLTIYFSIATSMLAALP